MKPLLFLLLLIPMVGFCQSEISSYLPSHSSIIELPAISKLETEWQLFDKGSIIKSVAHSFLSNAEESIKIDSSYNFHFTSALDSMLTTKSSYSYDKSKNLKSNSFFDLRDNSTLESYRFEYTVDENGNCTNTVYFTWNFILKQWIKRQVHENTYDDNKKLLKTISNGWNKDGAQLIPSKTEIKYDEHGNVLLEVSSGYNAILNQWVDQNKTEYVYKNNKCTLQINSSQWSGDPNPLKFNSKYEWEYDANGNLLSYIISSWSDAKWKGSKKDSYTYDINDRMTNHTYLLWETDHWRGVEKTDYSYDANGNKKEEIISQWDYVNGFPGDWINYRQTEYLNDSNGNETQSIISEWDRTGSQWKCRYKYETLYNDRNLLHSKIYYLMNITDSTWHPSDKYDYRYTPERKINIISRSLWSQSIHEWYIIQKQYFYYSPYELTNGIDLPENQKLKLYPNPACDVLTLEINDPTVTSGQLFDSHGQLIQSLSLELGVNTINISNLRQGMYLVKIKAKGETIVRKIIKN